MRFKNVITPEPLYIDTAKEAQKLAKTMMGLGRLGFDTETTGLNKVGDRVKFFSFGWEGTRFCAPVRLLPEFAEVLENPEIAKCMTNAKFDMHMAYNHGIQIQGHIYDTVAMDWLLDENRQGRHGLKFCSADYLGLRMAPFKQVFGSVGKVDKEVETLCHMHDALESEDRGWALELLALVGQLDMDQGVLGDLKKVSQSLSTGRENPSKLWGASQVLKIARKYGLSLIHI